MDDHLSGSDSKISGTHSETKVATPESLTPSTTPCPIVLPGVEKLFSQIDGSSKMSSPVPKSAPLTQDKAIQTSDTQLGNPFFIPNLTQAGDGINTPYMDSDFGSLINLHPSLNLFDGNTFPDFSKMRFNTPLAGGGIYEPGSDIAHLSPAQNAGNQATDPSAVHIFSSEPRSDTHQMLPLPPFSSTKEASSGLGHKPTTSHDHDAQETNIGGKYVANPVQNGKPWSSIYGVLKQAAGSKPSFATTGPSSTASESKLSSASVKYPSSRPTKPKSPLIRTSIKAPKPSRRQYERHGIPDIDSPPTTKPRHPTPPLTPIPYFPPVSQPPQSIDPSLVGRAPQSCPTSSTATPNRRVSPFQENPPQKTSVPAVLSRKRPISPPIRPAKRIHRKKISSRSHESERK
ncbi:86a29238-5ff1-4730-b89d-885471cef57b-CDS [Sclerotinia trifoliorum]|uniref:86a29238-5ff1-4730-b89d-885471cef57b-CDS n=1 Tax=Sclerotinia trifoliorum TaxID=28548 RepID=A0A8H2ZT59_9HELO|nr:86a29238-5ff1-4730-b89d-885471cef57b-CDS [Sclerotinia trifoliorum]